MVKDSFEPISDPKLPGATYLCSSGWIRPRDRRGKRHFRYKRWYVSSPIFSAVWTSAIISDEEIRHQKILENVKDILRIRRLAALTMLRDLVEEEMDRRKNKVIV